MKINYLETFGLKAALRGMRNPLQSHAKSDSGPGSDRYVIGPKDFELCLKLIKAGPSHRKFLRMIHIQCDVIGSLKFFDQFSTYVHVVTNSTSQMHTLGKRLLTHKDFYYIDDSLLSKINNYINELNEAEDPEDKGYCWLRLVNAIPQGFLYTRTIDMNYETFITMYKNRRNHKMQEWRDFCYILRLNLPYMDAFLEVLEEKNGTK